MPRAVKKKVLGKVFIALLPSVKMKSLSPRGTVFSRELHEFLLQRFGGYTVASGNITGYWKKPGRPEECNEHRRYEIAFAKAKDKAMLEKYLATLARELGEESIFCQTNDAALIIYANSHARQK